LFSSEKLYSRDKEQDVNNRKLVLHDKILPALSRFLRDRGELTKKTLDGVVYGALINLFATKMNEIEDTLDTDGNPRTKYVIPYEDICNKVKELTDGEDDPYHKQTFVSSDFGSITHNQILDICKNRFSGYKTKSGTGHDRKRVVEFIKEDVEREGKVFDAPTDIEIIEEKAEPQEVDREDESEIWIDWKQRTNGYVDS
jgi:hypothetical protein